MAGEITATSVVCRRLAGLLIVSGVAAEILWWARIANLELFIPAAAVLFGSGSIWYTILVIRGHRRGLGSSKFPALIISGLLLATVGKIGMVWIMEYVRASYQVIGFDLQVFFTGNLVTFMVIIGMSMIGMIMVLIGMIPWMAGCMGKCKSG